MTRLPRRVSRDSFVKAYVDAIARRFDGVYRVDVVVGAAYGAWADLHMNILLPGEIDVDPGYYTYRDGGPLCRDYPDRTLLRGGYGHMRAVIRPEDAKYIEYPPVTLFLDVEPKLED